MLTLLIAWLAGLLAQAGYPSAEKMARCVTTRLEHVGAMARIHRDLAERMRQNDLTAQKAMDKFLDQQRQQHELVQQVAQTRAEIAVMAAERKAEAEAEAKRKAEAEAKRKAEKK